MKSQRIAKNSAVIGGAVALLLISALLAASPALAGGGKISGTCKLGTTGVEPQASGQAKMTATLRFGDWGQPFYSGGVTVSCKGLTPGKHYYVDIEGDYWGAFADGFASGTGALVLQSGFESGYPFSGCYVSVYSDAGLVLRGGLR